MKASLVFTVDGRGGFSSVAENCIVGVSETWIVFEGVRPDIRCASKYGDADGCGGGGRDGCDGGGCDNYDVPGCDGGSRDGCDGVGSDGCDSNCCNIADCNGSGSDGCDVTRCNGGDSDGFDGYGSYGRDITGCNGGSSDGGVYVMVNAGVVVGAAASTEPTKPPRAPATATAR